MIAPLASHLWSILDIKQVFSLFQSDLKTDWNNIIQAMTPLWNGLKPVSFSSVKKIELIPQHLRLAVIEAALGSIEMSLSKREFEDVMVEAWISAYDANNIVHMLCKGRTTSDKWEILRFIQQLSIIQEEQLCHLIAPLAPHLQSFWDIQQLFSLVQSDLETDWNSIIHAMTPLWNGLKPVSFLSVKKIELIPQHLRLAVIEAALDSIKMSLSKREFEDVMVEAWIRMHAETDLVQTLCKGRYTSDKWRILEFIQRLPTIHAEQLCRTIAPLAPHLQSIWDIEQLFLLVQSDLKTDWSTIIQAMAPLWDGLKPVSFSSVKKIELIPQHLRLAVIEAVLDSIKMSSKRDFEDVMVDAWVSIYEENNSVNKLCKGRSISDKWNILKMVAQLPINVTEYSWHVVTRLAPLLQSTQDIEQLFALVLEEPEADWNNIIEAITPLERDLTPIPFSDVKKIKLVPSCFRLAVVQIAVELKKNRSFSTFQDVIADAWLSMYSENDPLQTLCKGLSIWGKWRILEIIARLPIDDRKRVCYVVASLQSQLPTRDTELLFAIVIEDPEADWDSIIQGITCLNQSVRFIYVSDIQIIKLIPPHLRLNVIQDAVKSMGDRPFYQPLPSLLADSWIKSYGDSHPIQGICSALSASEKWDILTITERLLPKHERESVFGGIQLLAERIGSSTDYESTCSAILNIPSESRYTTCYITKLIYDYLGSEFVGSKFTSHFSDLLPLANRYLQEKGYLTTSCEKFVSSLHRESDIAPFLPILDLLPLTDDDLVILNLSRSKMSVETVNK